MRRNNDMQPASRPSADVGPFEKHCDASNRASRSTSSFPGYSDDYEDPVLNNFPITTSLNSYADEAQFLSAGEDPIEGDS